MIRLILSLVIYFGVVSVSSAAQSFTVNFGNNDDAKTIGDLRPRVIALDKKPVPDVSIRYVMKRYRKLFETAASPEVRIDALDRLNNLSASYGIEEEGLTVDNYTKAEAVLDLYQRIVKSGDEYQRMDQLLYQTAKATAFTGDLLESIKRLELLIGLYPKSPLVDEATFRLAENYFELAEFEEAETFYSALIKRSKAPKLKTYARYKLAWVNYRLSSPDRSLASIGSFLENYPGVFSMRASTSLSAIPLTPSAYRGFDIALSDQLLGDGLRLVALLSENGDRVANIEDNATKLGRRTSEKIVLRALVDHLTSKQQYYDAARLIEMYTEDRPLDRFLVSYRYNVTELYQKGGHKVEAWKAKARFVADAGIRSAYWKSLDNSERTKLKPKLIPLVEQLAHLNYVRMQESKSRDQRRVKSARTSAGYYLQLSALQPNSVASQDALYLAATALGEAGQYAKAISLYDTVAYAALTPKIVTKPVAAYAGLDASLQSLKKAKYKTSWDESRVAQAQKYLDTFATHEQAPKVALSLAKHFVLSDGEPSNQGNATPKTPQRANSRGSQKAIALLANFERFTSAQQPSQVIASKQYAGLLYNNATTIAQYQNAEVAYKKALKVAQRRASGVQTKQLLAYEDGIASAIFQQAQLNTSTEQKVMHLMRLYDQYPAHKLSSGALFNAASLSLQSKNWTRSARLHRVFQSAYPNDALVLTSLQQLIAAFENLNQFSEAADALLLQANAHKKSDVLLSANSAYQAAQYYAQLELDGQASDAYQWLLRTHPRRTDLGIEAHYYVVTQRTSGTKQFASKAEAALSYIDKHNLDTARARTIGAELSFAVAENDKRRFYDAKIGQPFAKTLARKTKLLEACTLAYKRVVKFGVNEYSNAARFEMGSIFQALAFDIIESETPKGLSPLEQEQYAILLEEQAIPIEDEAIAMHKLNTEVIDQSDIDEWQIASFEALSTLNPSLYSRPIMKTQYVPTTQ